MKITRICAGLMAAAMASLALVGCSARNNPAHRYYNVPTPHVNTAPGTPAPPRVSAPRTTPRTTPHVTTPRSTPHVTAPRTAVPNATPHVTAPRTTTPNTTPRVIAPHTATPRVTTPNTATTPRVGTTHTTPSTRHHVTPHTTTPRVNDNNVNLNRHSLNRMDGLADNYDYMQSAPRVSSPRTLVPAVPSTPYATNHRIATDARRSVAVMNTDFSEIGVHSAEKKGWGHGGPVDEFGRSEGAVSYQKKYGHLSAVFIGPNENRVFLTFDEGYEQGFTPSILDTLANRGVSAVFFITLPYARQNPDLVRRMIDEGHVVGNHSTKHLSFPSMPLRDAANDIMELHNYMKDNFGYEMSLFRPPMGEFSEQVLALAQKLGYTSVFWSWTYKDWLVDNQPPAAESLNKLLREAAHPGAVILLHAVSQTNAEILGDAIDRLRELGYEVAEWGL